MTDIQEARGPRTLGSRLASSVLVIAVPTLVLAIIGLFAGTFGIGMPEISLLWVIWVVGLAWVWWPRRK